MGKDKIYVWDQSGTVNVRGKLYKKGEVVPIGGIDKKILARLIARGDLKEKKEEEKPSGKGNK